ncbi:glucosamine-6-phosphate deaminase [Tissierella carlieri]|uniref:Glucosamine-6-phosphate deaminase n=1 Tax=Tissierella carlieri TaxID=689904 RepID=A0ABT1SGT0_9FIRM|nr:glucosamine-6-phosphate deaminase [Tissierella carlieri]MCQ4925703.1 glucosamine-6-phosphate deaminase [Tissierella carlieri]
MKVLIEKDYKTISEVAARMIKDEIERKPNLTLGLATGSTPMGTYQELIRLYKEEGLDFSKVTTFNLDEYVGLDRDDPNSYSYHMRDVLFNHINVNLENTFIPNGKSKNLEDACASYDKIIRDKGGIDLQILGIGENGHIAFNEPSDKLNIYTSIVKLDDTTINANSRFFNSTEEVPKTAITMGMSSIMEARKIILMAHGKKKAPIVKRLLEAKHISTYIPASLLLLHPNVTFILTEEAYEA